MNELRKLLEAQEEKFALWGNRNQIKRFIVAEGLYHNYGDICNLPELLAMKHEYKYRLILDDSMAVGVLGTRGRGTPDHWNVNVHV
jgi:serine palmitoyltransferase